MTPERWRQITDVFHAALARDTAAREAFLEQACGADRDLRGEVDALLAAHRDAGRFGESAVARAEPRSAAARNRARRWARTASTA